MHMCCRTALLYASAFLTSTLRISVYAGERAGGRAMRAAGRVCSGEKDMDYLNVKYDWDPDVRLQKR